MLNTSLGRLRLIGILEGISLLVLMGIAMPLKYIAGKPEAVKVTGWIHGALFILFMIAVLVIYFQRRWPFKKLVLAFLAAFFPFGTFIFDRQLKKEELSDKEKKLTAFEQTDHPSALTVKNGKQEA